MNILETAQRLNEDIWMASFEDLLLKIVNTNTGRDFFGIEHDFPTIVSIRKNEIRGHLGGNSYVSRFFVGAKITNHIRANWESFKLIAKRFYDLEMNGKSATFVRGNNILVAAHATDTFYPDADPETTTVDGWVGRMSVNETFTTIRTGVGTALEDNGNAIATSIASSSTTDQWDYMLRGIMLFDTSTLLSGYTIDGATLGVFGMSKDADQYTQSIVLCSSNPASNTSLANADYDYNDFGTTDFSTRIGNPFFITNGYNYFPLNASGISNITKAGISKFGTRLSSDIDNTSPVWANSVAQRCGYSSSDEVSTNREPYLQVFYETGTGGGGIVAAIY